MTTIPLLSKIPQVAKAISAAVLALGAALSVAIQDGGVTTAEWINIAVATVVAGVGVWAIPNRAPAGVSPPPEE
jgi:hypothetical protein